MIILLDKHNITIFTSWILFIQSGFELFIFEYCIFFGAMNKTCQSLVTQGFETCHGFCLNFSRYETVPFL